MKLIHVRNFIFLMTLSMILHACSTTDSTVEVVESSPRTEQSQEQTETDEEQFTQVTLGMIDPVTNFDPLFAENLSTQRALSLVYGGLYTLDNEGNPVPEIASSVEISEDSLEYVFTLDPNTYYHNSAVFTAGIGRRVNASDVKWAFERTARSGVPPRAAQLLMGIVGFENFFLEQRSVYDEEKRVLEGVSGIQVLNSQTVGIVLSEKDTDFLKKLASPYLFIYPAEAVNNNDVGISNNPVGTGPYYLNRVEDSGRIVLSRYESANNLSDVTSLINRVDLVHYEDEGELYQSFANGDINWIPEIGPNISDQVLNDEGDISASYEGTYELVRNNAERISSLYLNQRSSVNKDWLINRLAYLTEEDISTRGTLTLDVVDFEIVENAEPREEYYAAYTDDAITHRLLTELNNIIFIPESSLVLFDIRVPTQQTSIYTYHSDSIHQQLDPMNENYWLRLDTKILGLHYGHVTGVEATSVPWLLNIREIGIDNSQASIE